MPNAWALGLGRLAVQSALGETLRAEIDVTSLTAEEASTCACAWRRPSRTALRVSTTTRCCPTPQWTLQRRADGNPTCG